MVDTVQKQMTLLPEYQEKYLKDLLANVFQANEETGEVTGIAATSPLYGQPVMDESGAQMYVAADGSYTSDINMASRDQFGEAIFATEGGVAAPDVMRFTDAQQEALNRLTGEGGFESMMGSYQPYLDSAKAAYQSGIDVAGTAGTASYDPMSYKDYYDPFVEEVGRFRKSIRCRARHRYRQVSSGIREVGCAAAVSSLQRRTNSGATSV